MCYRVRKGVYEGRHDGATRDTFTQSYIFEVLRAIKDGSPVKGYFQWTLTDNYEWGSWEPRFGLFRAEFEDSRVVIGPRDAAGADPGRCYGEVVSALRSGTIGRIADALTRDDW